MKRPFHIGGSSTLLMLATLLLLSGCSFVWVGPMSGTIAVLTGLLLGLALNTARAHHEGGAGAAVTVAPVAESGADSRGLVVLPADDDAAIEGVGDRVIGAGSAGGDGLADAVAARALAELDREGEWLVFGHQPSEPAPRAIVHGDGASVAGDSAMLLRGALQQSGAQATPAAGRERGIARHADLRVDGDGWSGADNNGFLLVADGGFPNPMEGDAEAIARGGITFNTMCGTYCHGGRGIGGGCPSLVDEGWIHGDSNLEVYQVIAGGTGDGTRMGAFGGRLTGDQIWEIIAYLRQRGKEFLMEKAGPGSFREQGLHCSGEILLTIRTNRNRDYQGVIVIEDTKSLTLEDRSGQRPTRRRVMKDRIDNVELQCVEPAP